MSNRTRVTLALTSFLMLAPAADAQEYLFVRGDCDANSVLQIADAIEGLRFLFQGEMVVCEQACDVDGDGTPAINDVVVFLSFLYTGGAQPSAPFPACGPGTPDGLSCDGPTPCGLFNPPPLILSEAPTTATENLPYSYTPTIDDNDPATLQYFLDESPSGATINPTTGSIDWTPGDDQNGPFDFTLRVLDAGGLEATEDFTVIVAAEPDPPMFTSTPPNMATELIELSYAITAVDPDPGDALNFSIVAGPASATIDGMGALVWTPSPLEMGAIDFTLRVTDLDGAFDDQTFTVAVADVDNPIQITSTPVLTGTELQPYSYDVMATDIDPNDTVTYMLTTFPTGASIDPTSGLITWTPSTSQPGLQDFVVVATSTGTVFPSAMQSFQVDIANVNQAPTFTSTAPTSATELQLLTYSATAADPDLGLGDALTFSIVSGPASVSIDSSTGEFTWTPLPTETGLQSITIQVTDNDLLSDDQIFIVDVTDVDNPVEITSAPGLTGTEGVAYAYDVTATDSDPGDTVTYSLTLAPLGAGINSATGEISWTPDFDQAGPNDFTVVATSTGTTFPTDMQSFTVDVTDVNQLPEFTTQPNLEAGQNELYTYDADATDGDGESVTFSLQVAPLGAEIDPSNGVITWTPDGSQVGGNAFTVLATDTNSDSTPQDFSVDVVQNLTSALRINAGGPDYTDLAGNLWQADELFDGGLAVVAQAPLPDILGTDDDELYLDQRVGMVGETFQYDIVLPVAEYQIEFLLSDPMASAPELFDISINGVVVASDLDLESGGVNTAQSLVTRGYEPDPDDICTVIEFVGTSGPARVAAISFSRIGDIFPEQPPQIVSTPPSAAVVGGLVSYQPVVEDLNVPDTTLFEILSGPGSVDPATGLVSYTPTASDVGIQTIVLQVVDGSGLTDTQTIDLDVMFGSQVPEALFKIVGSDIDSSTFPPNSLQLMNLAAGGQRVTSVTIDLSTTLLPDFVFDPADGTSPAGDSVSKCLEPDVNAVANLGYVEPVDPCADPFSTPYQDGFLELTANFTDFDFGESFLFSVDVDPTSIQGSTVSEGDEPGGVSGAELVGATVIVTFSDGQIATGELFPNPDDDQGAAQSLVKIAPLAPPSLDILGIDSSGGAPFQADIGSVDQIAFFSGPPNTPVTLFVLEGVLDVDSVPGGGSDIDPYEVNDAIVLQQYDTMLDGFGNQAIFFKLGETINPRSLNSVYYVTAVTRDATEPACTSQLSDSFVFDIDPALGPPPEALVTIGVGGIDTSVFGFGQFQIFNDALAGQKIVAVTVDFSTTIIPDLVWDPADGTPAGDVASSCLGAAFGETETGWIPPIDPCVDPYSNPDDSGNGYLTVDLAFDNFDNNEAFWFSGDVDPTSVQGATMSSPADPSGVSGVELTGVTVTVTFNDGTITSGQTFQVPGSLGGTQIRTKVTPPAAPTVEVLGVAVQSVDGDKTLGFVETSSIMVRVTGTPGDDVSVIVLEGVLDPTDQPMGGFDIDPFEINDVSAVLSSTVTLPMSGTIDVPFTLPETNAGTFNNVSYVCAVYRDPAVSQNTSLVSNVYRVDVDPTMFP